MPQLSYALLSDEALADSLANAPGWRVHEGKLAKTFEFASYPEGAAFVVAVGFQAERLNHHPDMLVGYKKVTVATVTHDSGGLTAYDFALASLIDGLVGAVS